MFAFLAPLIEALGLTSWMGAVRLAVAQVMGFIGVNLVNSGTRAVVAVGVITAWGVFLLVVTTGITGMHLFTLFSQNPLAGMPGDMFQLFCAVFPFNFLLRLTIAYIIWNFTFMQAALVMMRVNKFFFGG